jgi:5-(carboxyamino)imidazole ribonucleotide synthase
LSAVPDPAPRLGIVGGGQLGRMIALAAAPLGVRCTFVDPSPEAGARVAARQIVAEYDDVAALEELASVSDVITFEFENVSAPALAAIEAVADLAPSPRSLQVSQDRLSEKQLFHSLGIACAPYREVDSLADLEAAAADLGGRGILKTRRFGYDGKGQARLGGRGDAAAAWSTVGEAPSVLEGLVDFDRELSVVAVRSSTGETAVYPLAENVHRDGILRTSTAPAPGTDNDLAAHADDYATRIMDELEHVGVLALELFEAGGELIANEIAPRVHNSGHWTQNGAPTSQFENHVRAVLGLPLGNTRPAVSTTMVNLIGGVPDPATVLDVPSAHLHLYDKEPRPGRKVGHVNVTDPAGIAEIVELAETAAR